MKILLRITILILLNLTALLQADMGPYDWTYIHLNALRDEKVVQLTGFCNRIHKQAKLAAQDHSINEFFYLNLQYSRAAAQAAPPQEITQKIETLQSVFQEHYIRNWLSFYDILFIDTSGNIFYSIRKEADYGINITQNSSFDTMLSNCIRQQPTSEVFIDFHPYGASGEPASFFIEPITKNDKIIGWIALQLAVNKINSIFAGTENLGPTCEAFVVNRNGYMLTESNFIREETILKRKLDESNINYKFNEGRGNRLVTDYRGFKVLTSFEVFDFLGTQWLVVAKLDQAQVTTEHFKQHKEYYYKQIQDRLTKQIAAPEQSNLKPIPANKAIRRVDMDEFIRADHKEILQTMGVSTCTALVAMLPEKFGYMAHISPLDTSYGGVGTDLVSSITKKIKTYDIYKYERPHVKFVIIARHLNSLNAIVDRLVSEGFLLSQIKIMYYPQAQYARVAYDYSSDQLNVEWVMDKENIHTTLQHDDNSHNIGFIVKQTIDDRQEYYSILDKNGTNM